MLVVEPKNCIRSSKTWIGTKKQWVLGSQPFTPTDVAAEILKAVRAAVVKGTKCSDDAVIHAVITVPAYFESKQRDETKQAGQRAGFDVLQLITEPMAAAVAAGCELGLNQKVLVADLGGGTFDLSVLQPDVATHTYQAIDLDGDHHLGGDDFDKVVKDYLLQKIQEETGIDVAHSPEFDQAAARLQVAAEKAKKDLSSAEVADINEPEFLVTDQGAYNFEYTLTRDEFNRICQPLYDKIFQRVQRFVTTSDKFKLQDIATVVLAGGSCYIPYIQQKMAEMLQKPMDMRLDLTTIVVNGACRVAESLRGGLAADDVPKVVVKDILSHSLGVETEENGKVVLSKILTKGEVYPCAKTRHYTTTRDFQTTIPINIYEAGADCEDEKDIAKHDFYGSMELTNIAAEPAGKADIAVTFAYDKSGLLTVIAKDQASGRKEKITIRKGEKPTPPQMTPATDLFILMDTSGSMTNVSTRRTRLEEAQLAFKDLCTKYIDLTKNCMGLIEFNSNSYIISPLTHDTKKLVKASDKLHAEGMTYVVPAMELAGKEFAKASTKSQEKVIIVITDGLFMDDDSYDYYKTQTDNMVKIANTANKLKQTGIRIIAIGVSDAEEEQLETVASPGFVYNLKSMSELSGAFKQIVERICVKK